MEKKIGERDAQINSLLANKVELIHTIQSKEKTVSELEDSLAAKIIETNRLKETAVTEAHKMNRFNELVEIKISELRRELTAEVKATVGSKENHNRAALGVLRSIFDS